MAGTDATGSKCFESTKPVLYNLWVDDCVLM